MTPYMEMKLMAEAGERRRLELDRKIEIIDAERCALNARLTATDEHNDRLIAAINKVRETACLPASIEAILISALDRKEKN